MEVDGMVADPFSVFSIANNGTMVEFDVYGSHWINDFIYLNVNDLEIELLLIGVIEAGPYFFGSWVSG